MVEKFVANGEDITDFFYWPPPSGGGSGVGVGSQVPLYPLADKARAIAEKLRSLGRFSTRFYFNSGGSRAFLMEFVRVDLTTMKRDGRDTATITLLVVRAD